MVFMTFSKLCNESAVRKPALIYLIIEFCLNYDEIYDDLFQHLNKKYQLRFIDSLRLNVKGGHGGIY